MTFVLSRLPHTLLLLIAAFYSAAPELIKWPSGPEAIVAHVLGPALVIMTLLSLFSSFSFLRTAIAWVGLVLTLSPLLHPVGWPSALVIQAVVGLMTMAFAMIATTPREGGGWQRTLNVPVQEETSLEWS